MEEMGNEIFAVNITGISYSPLKPGYKNWLQNQIDGPFLVVSHSLKAVLPGKECKPLSVGVMCVCGYFNNERSEICFSNHFTRRKAFIFWQKEIHRYMCHFVYPKSTGQDLPEFKGR